MLRLCAFSNWQTVPCSIHRKAHGNGSGYLLRQCSGRCNLPSDLGPFSQGSQPSQGLGGKGEARRAPEAVAGRHGAAVAGAGRLAGRWTRRGGLFPSPCGEAQEFGQGLAYSPDKKCRETKRMGNHPKCPITAFSPCTLSTPFWRNHVHGWSNFTHKRMEAWHMVNVGSVLMENRKKKSLRRVV